MRRRKAGAVRAAAHPCQTMRAMRITEPVTVPNTAPNTVPTRLRLLGFSVLCNFAGAALSFAYFRAIDPSANSSAPPVRGSELGVFLVVFVLIFAAGRIASRRWMQPVNATLGAPPADASGDLARRRAVLMPAFIAAMSWAGWVLGGLAWGVLDRKSVV